jgi:RNA polymerase sigma-70 factor (ECF subfamily)
MPDWDRSKTYPSARLVSAGFRQYAAELHRFLLRRLRRPQDADDLAQEVFMRFLRLSNVELVRNPQAYLFGIASHVVREFHLHAEQEREHLTFDSEEAGEASENPGVLEPDELAGRLNLQQQLQRALTQLPPMHRAVLLLVKRDGLSHEEAAKAAGISFHTVEKYIVEARAKLKTMRWDR